MTKGNLGTTLYIILEIMFSQIRPVANFYKRTTSENLTNCPHIGIDFNPFLFGEDYFESFNMYI